MRQVPLERDINIATNGPFWVDIVNPEHPFTAMLISRSRGTCLIGADPRALLPAKRECWMRSATSQVAEKAHVKMLSITTWAAIFASTSPD